MTIPAGSVRREAVWAPRADAAEAAVVHRHLRRLWSLPSTRLGRVRWPGDVPSGTFVVWHYWWQAHLIDCAVDAAVRAPTPTRRRRLARLARTPWLRNCVSRSGSLGWRRDYHDDMAWMALALERAHRLCGVRRPRAVDTLTAALREASGPECAPLPWRRGGDFLNAPSNGPAAILFARTGDTARASALCDWIDAGLRDPATGLIHDGVRPGGLEPAFYTYCQGVVLGAETELAVRTGRPEHAQRIRRLLAAITEGVCTDGVLRGQGGGDGGLFAGILARHLAETACGLPDTIPDVGILRETAATLVMASAQAAWDNRIEIDTEPLFGPDWATPAVVPAALYRPDDPSARVPERDLSVQLSGWMLMEAAARVEDAARMEGGR